MSKVVMSKPQKCIGSYKSKKAVFSPLLKLQIFAVFKGLWPVGRRENREETMENRRDSETVSKKGYVLFGFLESFLPLAYALGIAPQTQKIGR